MPHNKPSRRGCGCGTLALGCLGVIVLLSVALAIGAAFIWWQWTSTPKYWEEHRDRIARLTPAERDERAEAVEHRLSRWLSQANGADPQRNYAADVEASHTPEPTPDAQTLSMRFDEVNAWLDRRLTAWLQQQEIDLDLPVRDVIVTSDDGQLVVAGDVRLRQFEQVVSAVIDANLLPDGDLRIHVDHIRIGRVPLPSEAVAHYLRAHLPQDQHTQAVERALTIFEGTTITPVHRIDNTRQVRLTGWAVGDDGIELTIETVPREPSN